MKSTFGKNIKVSIWGGSHEPAIGVDIAGLPLGTVIDMEMLTAFLKRRAPGNSPFATKRKEPDIPVPVRGLTPIAGGNEAFSNEAKTSGKRSATNEETLHRHGIAKEHEVFISPTSQQPRFMTVSSETVSLEIRNTDTRSTDYKALQSIPRPGHADYTARLRYGNTLNMAGGGPFSARMTAPLCIAGGIAIQLLAKRGVTVGAHIRSVADICDTPFDSVSVNQPLLEALKTKDFTVIDDKAGLKMQQRILEARDELDSVGGTVEVCAVGIPAGIGGAMYDGLESVLAPIFFGIPAVKGVEFGTGFGAALLKGSENNDAFYYPGPSNNEACDSSCNTVKTRTNHHGGILGGITTGMPLIARLAFKPTPSIAKEQDSVDLDKKENTKLIIHGRHDPCVVVRAVPIVEAALAIGLLDCMLEAHK